MNRIRIKYKKHFVTGLLMNLTVDASFTVPDLTHAESYRDALALFTQDSPGIETVTRNKFWVSDIEFESESIH
jgi:hypothetical protein